MNTQIRSSNEEYKTRNDLSVRASYHGESVMRERQIRTDADLLAVMKAGGLDYKVTKIPMTHPHTGEVIPFFATMREDTGAILGAGLSDRYTVIQNSDAWGMAADITKLTGGITSFAKAHTFNGGASAALQIDLGQMIVGDAKMNDVVMKRVTLKNAHDGSGSSELAVTPYRLRCKNGLSIMDKSGRLSIAIRHTATAEKRMKQTAMALAHLEKQLTATETAYNVLNKTPVTKAVIAETLEKLFPSKNKEKQAAKNAAEAKDAILHYYMDADANTTDRETGWNLYNAITRYTTHDAPVRSHGGGDARFQAMISGSIAQKAYGALSTVIDVLDVEDDIARILRSVETSQAATLATYAQPEAHQTSAYSIFDLAVG